MNKFQFKKEKIPSLTLQDIRELGWQEKDIKNEDSIVTWFEKDNYFLSCYATMDNIPVIRIHAKDPTLITWMPDPENFRMTFQCPNKEFFEIVTSTL
jgi:hypothetical protein